MIFILMPAVALALLLLLVFARKSRVAGPEDVFVGIDVQSFRRLVDPEEARQLRELVSARDFRRLQRKRALVALRYLRKISKDASLLMRYASAPEIARDPFSVQLRREALQVRLLAWRTSLIVLVWFVLPGARFEMPIAKQYSSLHSHFDQWRRETSVAL